MKFMMIMVFLPLIFIVMGGLAGVLRIGAGLLVIPVFGMVLSFIYILAVYLDFSGPWLLFLKIWSTTGAALILPWSMLIVAIAAGSWKGSAAEQVHANLSPEDKAKVQDFGKTVFEAGCKSYEDYLQKEGKLNAAGVVNKLRQL